MIVKVHGKVNGELQEFFIINPQNLVVNEMPVPGTGGITGLDGKPVSTNKMVINYPNGMKLVIEEFRDELLELFSDGKDTGISSSIVE